MLCAALLAQAPSSSVSLLGEVTSRVNSPMFEAGFVLGNRYRLDEPLASGGMAEVWKGHDTILQRAVALKLLHPHLAYDPTVVERFRREAIAAARLAHPHIVPTFDTGAEDGLGFIVMGLVHGPTLREVINAEAPVPVAKIALVGRQIADALEHAHSRGIIHRDVKPANVLLVEGTRVMVTDFGIAKAIEEVAEISLTMPGLVIATPGYSAPEQLAGRETDERTDIYALGVLLHEMSCGHTGGDNPTTQLEAYEFATDGHACETLAPELKEIIGTATASHPTSRFQTAAEMRDELSKLERKRPWAATIPRQEPSTSETPAARSAPALEPTLIRPAKPPPPPTTSGAKKRRKVTVIVVLVMVLAAAGIGKIAGSIGDQKSNTKAPTKQAAPVASLTAGSFDPFGDKSEHAADAQKAVDGNISTAWSTETYADRKMGKKGVGIIVKTGTSETLRNLEVDSRSQGWSATIYVGSDSPQSFEAWGDPVDVQSGLGSAATFDLHKKSGDSVLLWITDLGDTKQFSATEIRVIPQ